VQSEAKSALTIQELEGQLDDARAARRLAEERLEVMLTKENMATLDLRKDRDAARQEAQLLRKQLGADGPVRNKIEELIDAVKRLTEERDRLLALSSDATAERDRTQQEIENLRGTQENTLQSELALAHERERVTQQELVQARQEIVDLRENELSTRRLHQDDAQRQKQQHAEAMAQLSRELVVAKAKCAAHEKEIKMLKFYMSTLPLPEEKPAFSNGSPPHAVEKLPD